MPNTPWTVGNQFGYVCPTCGRGDHLTVFATVETELLPDGATADGDQEWDMESGARCKACYWHGNVTDFKTLDDFQEEA